MKEIKNVCLAIGAVFAAIGLFFAGFGVWQWSVCDRLVREGESVQAVCRWESSDDLWFRFEAEGQTWDIRSSMRSDSIRTGDEITVYYMSGNPRGARIVEWWTYGIFMIMGSVFALVGLGFLAWQWHVSVLIRSLHIDGRKVMAKVTGVKQVHWVRINGCCPYVVHAVCIHPYTGNEMQVKSRLLMYSPAMLLSEGQVEVLVDIMNEKRYHMLVD